MIQHSSLECRCDLAIKRRKVLDEKLTGEGISLSC